MAECVMRASFSDPFAAAAAAAVARRKGQESGNSRRKQRRLRPFNGEKGVFFQPRLLVVKHSRSWTRRARGGLPLFVHS